MLSSLSQRKAVILSIALIVVLGAIAYSNTLGVPFVLDDGSVIERNQRIRDVSNISSMFVEINGPWGSRPLLHATNAINYHFGGLDTTGYHAVNIALHLLNGVLLCLLVLFTGRRLGHDDNGVMVVAAFSSLVFVLHPVQTEAVTNIVNRSTLMATTFCFLGLILFIKAVTAERGSGLYLLALFVSSLLGMASRENFVVFPVFLLLYDFLFLSDRNPAKTARHYRAYGPVVLSLGYFVFIALNNTYKTPETFRAGVSAADYVATEFRVHWSYLRLLLLPMGQNLDYDYPITKSLLELPAAISLLGYTGLWAMVLMLTRKRPAVSFGMLWFLVALMPISFAVAALDLTLDDVMFEHRLYLPGAGAIVAATTAAAFLLGRIKSDRVKKAALICVAVIPLVLASGTFARNSVWQNKLSIWEDVVRKSPGWWRGHYNLGNEYAAVGRNDDALEQYRISVRLSPTIAAPHINMGNVYMNRGLYDKAIEQYGIATGLTPDDVTVHYNMATAYYYKGQYDKAIEQYNAVIRLNPDHADAHNDLGATYFKLGRMDLAAREFEAALWLNPNLPEARNFFMMFPPSE